LASSRTAYPKKNEDLARSFYAFLLSGTTQRTVGQAYAHAKLEGNNLNDNQKSYVLLGDPSLRMMRITDSVSLSVVDEQGRRDDTLKAFQSITVKGTVLRNGARNAMFGSSAQPAQVQIGLFNPPLDSVNRKDNGTGGKVTYSLPGAPVFIGKTAVVNGAFAQKVFLPRRLTENAPGVKLVAYAYDQANATAVGHKDDIVFLGQEQLNASDSLGPDIMIRAVYEQDAWNASAGPADEIAATLPLELAIHLYDESGIDAVGAGPDEGLLFEIEEVRPKRNINHKFQFDEGDFRQGRATMVIQQGELETGEYTLAVSAQDLIGNISRASMTLRILEESEFELGPVFNYPNPVPMGSSTRFYIYHSNTRANSPVFYQGDVDASIYIYTMSGRLIRVLRHVRENGVAWDLTDQRGVALPPNMYLWRAAATVELQGERVVRGPIRKLVIHPPR
jgi:hypothetical protein